MIPKSVGSTGLTSDVDSFITVISRPLTKIMRLDRVVERLSSLSCNMLSLKRFMQVAVNASSSEIRVGVTTITS